MYRALDIVTVLIVVLAIVPAVAHALELPGKMRLSKDEYITIKQFVAICATRPQKHVLNAVVNSL